MSHLGRKSVVFTEALEAVSARLGDPAAQPRPLPRASLLKRPRQQRSVDMVHQIIDATLRVLERDGHAALTTHTVADEAGISVGSLYQYFANKDMLYAAVVERAVLHAQSWFATLFAAMADQPLERILHAAVASADVMVKPYLGSIRELLAAVPVFSDTGLPALLRRPFLDISLEYFAHQGDRYQIPGGTAAIVVAIDMLMMMVLRRSADTASTTGDDEYYGICIAMVMSQLRE